MHIPASNDALLDTMDDFVGLAENPITQDQFSDIMVYPSCDSICAPLTSIPASYAAESKDPDKRSECGEPVSIPSASSLVATLQDSAHVIHRPRDHLASSWVHHGSLLFIRGVRFLWLEL